MECLSCAQHSSMYSTSRYSFNPQKNPLRWILTTILFYNEKLKPERLSNLLFLKHVKHISAQGPLYFLFPLPGICFSQESIHRTQMSPFHGSFLNNLI